jgi:MFS transporter, SP family, sugar:H+ symporter
MYIERVSPMKSAKWVAPSKEEMSRIRKEAGTELPTDGNNAEDVGGEMARGTLSGETERNHGVEGEHKMEDIDGVGAGHRERV